MSVQKIKATPHICHARNCKTPVPRRLLMCLKHWKMVPRILQHKVWATYQNGQEIGKATPSAEWHKAADEAIDAVFKKEQEKAAKETLKQMELRGV